MVLMMREPLHPVVGVVVLVVPVVHQRLLVVRLPVVAAVAGRIVALVVSMSVLPLKVMMVRHGRWLPSGVSVIVNAVRLSWSVCALIRSGSCVM